MGWWQRWRTGSARQGTGVVPGRSDGPQMQVDADAVSRHLEDFARSRIGVEAYVEPATPVTPTTVVLVARDGEWTRRAVGEPRLAARLGARLGIPVYDVNQTGYPPRMREWSARKRREERRDGRGSAATG